MIANGDPEAVQLSIDYKGAQMTAFTNLDKEHMEALLKYLQYSSSEKPVE
jgi:hypothetical protein